MIKVYLKTHEEYLRLIKLLYEKASYIEYVPITKEDPINNFELIKLLKENIIKEQLVNKWIGTTIKSKPKNTKYTAYFTKEIYTKLKTHESFFWTEFTFFSKDLVIGALQVPTDWGYSDISFFDSNGKLVCTTITHEAVLAIDESIFEKLELSY